MFIAQNTITIPSKKSQEMSYARFPVFLLVCGLQNGLAKCFLTVIHSACLRLHLSHTEDKSLKKPGLLHRSVCLLLPRKKEKCFLSSYIQDNLCVLIYSTFHHRENSTLQTSHCNHLYIQGSFKKCIET